MTEAKSKPPKIFAALAGVMHDLKELPKGDRNQQQKYDYRGIDSLMNLAHVSMDKHKVIVLPAVLSEPVIELGPVARSGNQMYRSLVKVQYTFLSTEDGSTVVSGPFIGEATDMADKATNKAQTAAYKWCFFQTFCLPTDGSMVDSEGDDDSNGGTKPPAKPGAKGEKPKDTPPKKETADDKDARHKAELIAIIGHIAGKDKDPKGRAKSLIIEWTEYTEDGESKCLDSIRDPQDPTRKAWHPKLKGKWLNTVLAKARPAYTVWLGANPGEESKVAKVTKGAK